MTGLILWPSSGFNHVASALHQTQRRVSLEFLLSAGANDEKQG